LGIRSVLGADPKELMRMVQWQGLRPVALGVLGGGLLAVWIGKLVRHRLFEVSAADPVILLAGVGGVLAVGWAACYAAARRTVHLQPSVALRDVQHPHF